MKKLDLSMQGLFCYLCVIASMLFNGIFGVTHNVTAGIFLCLSVLAFAAAVVTIVHTARQTESR